VTKLGRTQPGDDARSLGEIIRLPSRLVVRTPSERVAALMIVMEERPLTEPVIRIAVGLDRVWRVQVGVGDQAAVLTPAEARLCAEALRAENAIPGCGLVAVRLDEAAERAEMAMPYTPRRVGRPAWADDRGEQEGPRRVGKPIWADERGQLTGPRRVEKAQPSDRGPPEYGRTGSGVLIGLALVAALAVILGSLPTGGGL